MKYIECYQDHKGQTRIMINERIYDNVTMASLMRLVRQIIKKQTVNKCDISPNINRVGWSVRIHK